MLLPFTPFIFASAPPLSLSLPMLRFPRYFHTPPDSSPANAIAATRQRAAVMPLSAFSRRQPPLFISPRRQLLRLRQLPPFADAPALADAPIAFSRCRRAAATLRHY
jgi:hypothetical protein